MNNKCAICNKDMLRGDILVKDGVDIRRLIYNEDGSEKNFLIPDGQVHSVIKFYLCNDCSNNIMMKTPKDIAEAITGKKKYHQFYDECDRINDLDNAHTFSINNRSAILKDKKCGCFFCMKIFSPDEITEWIEDKTDNTAMCPYCNIDSVIGESSGFPITREFLSEMNKYFFGIQSACCE